MQWKLVLALQVEFTIITHQSIDGITYLNHFNFEQRYSNVRECDPFYWHPLHLPDHCAGMFEDLIRSRVAAYTPVRIARRRSKPNIYSFNADYQSDYSDENLSEDLSDLSDDYHSLHSKSQKYLRYDNYDSEADDSMSPYEEMLSLLKRDVKKNPTAPVVRIVPPYGPVAMYKQPISKKSRKLIKKIARAYADAGRTTDGEDSYYGKIDIRYPPNNVDEQKVLRKLEYETNDKEKKSMRDSEKKTKNNDIKSLKLEN